MSTTSALFQQTLLLFWDVESTSDDPNKDHIISLGGVLATFNTGIISKVSEFHSYVSTSLRIDPVAQAVHNISSEMLSSAPSFADMIVQFEAWLKPFVQASKARVVFLAHNGRKFDDVMLYCNFLQSRLDYGAFLDRICCWGFADTLKILKTLFAGKTPRNRFTLDICYSYFCKRQQLVNAHDALVDSNALFDIFSTQTVTTTIGNMRRLFDFVVPRAKALQWVKSTSAVEYERIEQEMQNKALGLSQGQDTEEAILNAFSLSYQKPCWEPGDATPDNLRLCLRCVQYFKPDDHQGCWSL